MIEILKVSSQFMQTIHNVTGRKKSLDEYGLKLPRNLLAGCDFLLKLLP